MQDMQPNQPFPKALQKMFPHQKIILEAIPTLRDMLPRYGWQAEPMNWLYDAEEKSTGFIISVPLVGAFSSGKSSIINALLGSPVFATGIDPETAVPAEVFYGETESLTGCLPDGCRIPLDRETVRNNKLDALHGGGWVEAVFPLPQLASLSHLRLVDMPGWESGVKAHSAAIDNYASRSLAYGVVVSADEGGLRESIRKALKELALHDMPVFAIISKADKKPPEDIEAIIEQVTQDISHTMGKPPFKAIKVSERQNDTDELIAALQELENQAEPLFYRNITTPFLGKLRSLEDHLCVLLNSDDLDSDSIKVECAQLKSDMLAFEVRLDEETTQLDARVQPVLGRIIQHLTACLKSQLNSLATQASNGNDLQGPIGTTVRLAVEQGLRDEFRPEVERYLDRISEGLPPNFSPTVATSFNFDRSLKSRESEPSAFAPLFALIKSSEKLDPKLLVAVTLIEYGLGLFEKFLDSKDLRDREARQLEEAKQALLTQVIPQVTEQVKTVLQRMLYSQVQEAKQKIVAVIGAQQASHEAALNELQRKLAQGESGFAQACVQYEDDRALIQNIVLKLKNA